MIRFGPAGIPLSCKGRTLKDGVEDVHSLSLTAMEVQMVRSGTFVMTPEEDDVGLTIKDIKDRLIVEFYRDGDLIIDPDEPIDEDDELVCMFSGVTNGFGDLYTIGDIAKRLDVSLSLHTPYYMDLTSKSDLTDECFDSIRHSAIVANALGANIVTTNLGIYDPDTYEDEENILDNLTNLAGWWDEFGMRPKLGIEVTGRDNIYGSLEQVLDICDDFKGFAVPVINWPHYYSRSMLGVTDPEEVQIWKEEDFQYAIEQAATFNDGKVHTLFSGIEHHDWTNIRLSPIKKGTLKFEALADCLVDMRPDITIISSSPLLEHDAMYMRTIHERALAKKVGKMLKPKRKEEAEASAASGESA